MPLPFRRDRVSTKDTLNEKNTKSKALRRSTNRQLTKLAGIPPALSSALNHGWFQHRALPNTTLVECFTCNIPPTSSRSRYHHSLSVRCEISSIHSNGPSIHPPSTQHQNRRNSGVQQLLAMLRKTSNRTQHAVYILSTNTTCVGSSPSPTGARHTRA